MVQVSGFYEDRLENISTQRWREGWKPPSSVPQSRKMVPNKETDAVILENLKDQESTTPQSKSAPLSQDHGNKGDFFTQQLKEIDKDLGIYEDPLNAAATNSISNKEVSPLFDLENLKNSLEVNPGLPPQHFFSYQNHKESNTHLHDITNSSPHHMVSETPPQVKWKRLQRVSEVFTGTRIDHAGSKCPIYLVTYQCESPSKKLQASHDDKENTPMLAKAGSQPHQAQ